MSVSFAFRSLVARTRTRLGRASPTGDERDATLKVLVSGRPPSHRLRYVDQILGDSSVSSPPVGIEFEYRDTPNGRDSVDVVHLTDSAAVLGNRRVPESEKVLRATAFTRALKRRRVALVRTVTADVDQDSRGSRAEAILDSATSKYITHSSHRTIPHAREAALIPHAHLRFRFLGYPRGVAQAGRVLFVSPESFHSAYEAAMKVFAYANLPAHTLRIVGKIPSRLTSSFARTINLNSKTITLLDETISDAARVEEISKAELVVIVAPETDESMSTMLLALSLDRPVLVEDTPFTRDLAAEVGSTWVRLHSGRLTAATLEKALAALADTPPTGRPALDGRDPDTISQQFAAVYRSAAASR